MTIGAVTADEAPASSLMEIRCPCGSLSTQVGQVITPWG